MSLQHAHLGAVLQLPRCWRRSQLPGSVRLRRKLVVPITMLEHFIKGLTNASFTASNIIRRIRRL